ncbi:MAG: transporter substrate-binding domain-containing protein [bacterium]|nr:transporter substrate-binding domain-containing protein [bacterium]
MNKKILFLLMALLLVFSCGKDKGKDYEIIDVTKEEKIDPNAVKLAYVDFAPYEYSDNGKPAGILVEIVQKVCKNAGVPIHLKLLPFKRALKMVKEGQMDGLFNFYKTPERLKSFDYSEPIITNPLVNFVRKDSALNYRTLNDLNGKKVGVMRGYTYGVEFDGNKKILKQETDSHESNFKKLVYSRIDVYPCDKLVGIYLARKAKLMNELKTLPVPLRVMKGHIGFTKGKHTAVIEKLNKQIEKMEKSGEIDNIITAYLNK